MNNNNILRVQYKSPFNIDDDTFNELFTFDAEYQSEMERICALKRKINHIKWTEIDEYKKLYKIYHELHNFLEHIMSQASGLAAHYEHLRGKYGIYY